MIHVYISWWGLVWSLGSPMKNWSLIKHVFGSKRIYSIFSKFLHVLRRCMFVYCVPASLFIASLVTLTLTLSAISKSCTHSVTSSKYNNDSGRIVCGGNAASQARCDTFRVGCLYSVSWLPWLPVKVSRLNTLCRLLGSRDTGGLEIVEMCRGCLLQVI